MEGVVDGAFWRGRKVFLTGHTGFKGAWLTLWLRKLGSDVVGYSDARPSDPCLFDLIDIESETTSLRGDVRDLGRLLAAFQEHRPEIVVHLAAQSLVRRSFERPVDTFETNVLGTVNVLEAARATGTVRAVVVVTSDKCYEERGERRPHVEDDPKGGDDPYSASKACAELVTAAYRAAIFGPAVAVASVRAGNVIGGGDWGADRLVPDVMRAALEGRPLRIRNPEAIRPWQHVLEPLSGYLLLAERLWDDGGYAGGWNFGPISLDPVPVRSLVERIARLWEEKIEWLEGRADDPPEEPYLQLDSAKARRLLGWSPRWSLDQALEATVAWYRAFAAREDVRAVAERQIDAYCAAPAPG